MDDGRTLSTEQVAVRLGMSRETVNQYAQALETATNQSLKVAGGARRFGAAELATFRHIRRTLEDTPGIGLEMACQQALEASTGTDDDGAGASEALRELLASLSRASIGLETLIAQTRDFSAARGRLKRTIDDCGTEVMEIGARMRDWPKQMAEFKAVLKNLSELDGRIHARLQEVNALLDEHITRTLERAVPIWIACGIGAYVVGFVILPGLFTVLGWRR
jgi:transcriptional regulator with XRE-family HTH domain